MISQRYYVIVLLLIGLCLSLFSQEPIKVACVGNSITYGDGISYRTEEELLAEFEVSQAELTDYEKMILLEHSVIGADIITEIPLLEKAAKIVRYHHERYNGSGYPKGLRGDDIPMFTRLVTVADEHGDIITP